jgi:hypothetical protein
MLRPSFLVAPINEGPLIACLLGEPLVLPDGGTRHTTAYWYHRACRAAVAGGAGSCQARSAESAPTNRRWL